MVINHNIASLNANRQMGINQTNSSKSMEKLSSGLRINKAGDDAAGLAISEKMRAQVRGLDQASANSQDAISMIQTAEGALSETHSILQRMRELAVQSSTDTNTADDRTKIQSEVDQLAKEITRISNTTEFNTQNLMAGGLNNTFHIGANEGQNVSLSINSMDASSLGVADSLKSSQNLVAGTSGISTVANASRGLVEDTYTINVTKSAASVADGQGLVIDAGNTSALTAAANVTGTYTGAKDKNLMIEVTAVDGAAAGNGIDAIKYSTDNGQSWTSATVDMDATGLAIDGLTVELQVSAGAAWRTGDRVSFALTASEATLTLEDSTGAQIGTGVEVHNGDSSATLGSATNGKTIEASFDYADLTTAQSADFDVVEYDSTKATTNDGKVMQQADTQAGINVSSQSAANDAITKVNDAITKVSEERSKLGAFQNRLEHTIANLGTSSENLTSAESRIRDVNMAKEMSTFSKNNILAQAAQSMLAQANQQPQQVLQLLQ